MWAQRVYFLRACSRSVASDGWRPWRSGAAQGDASTSAAYVGYVSIASTARGPTAERCRSVNRLLHQLHRRVRESAGAVDLQPCIQRTREKCRMELTRQQIHSGAVESQLQVG